jgi:hypothetical protein
MSMLNGIVVDILDTFPEVLFITDRVLPETILPYRLPLSQPARTFQLEAYSSFE